MLNKSTLILGEDYSGILSKAKEIAQNYKCNEVEFIPFIFFKGIKRPFFYQNCTKETKLIVVDHLENIAQTYIFFNEVVNSITVNKKNDYSFEISPKFLLICNQKADKELISNLGPSFHERFDLIDSNTSENKQK